MIKRRYKIQAVLVLFLAGIIFNLWFKNSFAVYIEGMATQELQQSQAQPQAVIQTQVERPQIEYKAENLRDPFQSAFAKGPAVRPGEQAGSVTLPTLAVEGIIWGGAFPQAIINGQVVKVGDEIEGAKVTKIDKGSVSVLFGGAEFNLSTQKKPEGGQNDRQN